MSCINKRFPLFKVRATGRGPSNYPVDGAGIPLRITRSYPMKLPNVTVESLNEKKKSKDVYCLPEMMTLFDCLEKHDFDTSPCQQHVKTLENCYVASKNTKQTVANHKHVNAIKNRR